MNTAHPESDSAKHTYTYDYPRPAVTVDVVVFTFSQGELQVLLIRRRHPPYAGAWALPGGFVEMDESLASAAARELWEETQLRDVHIEQLHTYGAPDRDPRGRVISVAHSALLSPEQRERSQLRAGSDAADIVWWDIRALPPLAFDHADIVACALHRLRQDVEQCGATLSLLPAEFTLEQAHGLFQAVQTEPLDRGHIRRKLLNGVAVEETGGNVEVDNRQVRLYRRTA